MLVPFELRQEEETILHNSRAGEKVEHYETVRMTKEGKKINVSLTISPLRDAAGGIVGSSRIARDITERKRAEQELRKSEKRFRLMADSAPMLIWLSGPDTLATDFNQAWLEFTGRTVQQELGEGWIINLHPDDLHRHLEAYADAFEKRQKFTSEYRMRRHDGQYRWMLDQSVPRFMDDGSFAGYVGYCFDISDQKETAAARIELGGRLIHAQEAERERIARELHDNINQRVALLANGLQEFEQATSANYDSLQKSQLQELWHLTNEISVDIQHVSHQLHPSKLHYLGLATAVRDLCREFSRQHKFELECVVRDLPQDLEETISLSLFRTVQESLHNVVKHSHARHVKVELTRQSSVVELRVSDDGIGFNPEQARENHGLGLISMRERLRSVGGEFFIWSAPSQGTQVKGTVPATTKAGHKGGEEPAA
jgi:PAS domain S-box-containing protein